MANIKLKPTDRFLEEKYEVLEERGTGGFATVYKVRDKETNVIKALKVSKQEINNPEDKAVKQFINECLVQMTLGSRHPNIVKANEPLIMNNRAVVEMDYVEGYTLFEYLKAHRFFSLNEFYRFIQEIVGALAYCHHDVYRHLMDVNNDNIKLDRNNDPIIDDAKRAELVKKYGIIHNDLHTNNIMIRFIDGSFVLLDFGLSMQDNNCVKSSAVGGGAVEYRSPEKCSSSVTKESITPMSDIYSLGVILFELLAGTVPFPIDLNRWEANNISEAARIQDAHVKAPIPAIEPLRKKAYEEANPGKTYEKDYPDWLENVVRKCLAKNPTDRYRDARELLDDINAHIEADKQKEAELLKAIIEQAEEASKIAGMGNELVERLNDLESQNEELANLIQNKETEITILQAKLAEEKDNRNKQNASDSSSNEALTKAKEEIEKLKNQLDENNKIISAHNDEIAKLQKGGGKKKLNIIWAVIALILCGASLFTGSKFMSDNASDPAVIAQYQDSLAKQDSIVTAQQNYINELIKNSGNEDALKAKIAEQAKQIESLKKAIMN